MSIHFFRVVPYKYITICIKRHLVLVAFLVLSTLPLEGSRPWTLYGAFQADGFLKESAYKALIDLEHTIKKVSDGSLWAVVDLFEGSSYSRYSLHRSGKQLVETGIVDSLVGTMKKGLTLAFKGRAGSRTMVIYSGHGSGCLEPKNERVGDVSGKQADTYSAVLAYQQRQYRFFADKVHGTAKKDVAYEVPSKVQCKALFIQNPTGEVPTPSLCACLAWIRREYLEGKKIDIVGFDACQMAMIELANELSPSVRYMIASQEREYKNGWDYKALIKSLHEEKGARSLVRRVVYEYGSKQRACAGISYSLSALHLSRIAQVVTHLERVALYSCESLQSSQGVHEGICEARLRLRQRSLHERYVDLCSYCEELLIELSLLPATSSTRSLQQALHDLLCVTQQAIEASVSSYDRATLKGCSVYFPLHYTPVIYTCSLASLSGWFSFLHTFNGLKL